MLKKSVKISLIVDLILAQPSELVDDQPAHNVLRPSLNGPILFETYRTIIWPKYDVSGF